MHFQPEVSFTATAVTNLQPSGQVRHMNHTCPPRCRGLCGQTLATKVMQSVNHHTTDCSSHMKSTYCFHTAEYIKFKLKYQCETDSNAAKAPRVVGPLQLTYVPVQVNRDVLLEVRLEFMVHIHQQPIHGVPPRQMFLQKVDTCSHIFSPIVWDRLDRQHWGAPNGLRLNSSEQPHSQSKAMNSCIKIHQQHSQIQIGKISSQDAMRTP